MIKLDCMRTNPWNIKHLDLFRTLHDNRLGETLLASFEVHCNFRGSLYHLQHFKNKPKLCAVSNSGNRVNPIRKIWELFSDCLNGTMHWIISGPCFWELESDELKGRSEMVATRTKSTTKNGMALRIPPSQTHSPFHTQTSIYTTHKQQSHTYHTDQVIIFLLPFTPPLLHTFLTPIQPLPHAQALQAVILRYSYAVKIIWPEFTEHRFLEHPCIFYIIHHPEPRPLPLIWPLRPETSRQGDQTDDLWQSYSANNRTTTFRSPDISGSVRAKHSMLSW